MEEERRATFLKDEYGGWRIWVDLVFTFMVISLVVLFIIGIIIGLTAIQDYYEIQAFNRIHGTDYTFGEWFWGEGLIKKYHLGPVENQNLNIDLNIKGLEVEDK